MADENFDGGEIVGDSAPAQTNDAPDTSSSNEVADDSDSNIWDDILNNNEPEPETPSQADENEEELSDDEADEKIPAKNDDANSETETDTGEKKTRSGKFKEIQESNAELESRLTTQSEELTTIKSKYDLLDTALEAVGGADQAAALADNQAKFMDPARYKEAVDFINTLPQKDVITAEILNRSFDVGEVKLTPQQKAVAYQNRAEVVNGALAKDFGLSEKLSPDELSSAFEWIAARANKDKSEWMTDIADELELLAPDEESAAKRETQRRISELEKQLEEQKTGKPADAEKEPEKIDEQQIVTKLSNFVDDSIKSVAGDVLKDYKTSLDKLPPFTQKAINALIRQETAGSQTFLQLADYLVTDSTEHEFAKHLTLQYRNQVKTILRSVAAEFLVKAPAEKPVKKIPEPVIAGQQKGSIKPAADKKAANPWGEIMEER